MSVPPIRPLPPPSDWVALRSRRDIAGLNRAARLAWTAVRAGIGVGRAGLTTAEVEGAVREAILAGGGRPAFDGYRPPGARTAFTGAACISVNDEAVHARPGGRVLQPGDLVTIDAGVELDGWFGDVAESVVLRGGDPHAERLLRGCRRAVGAGVRACGPGVWWSIVARAVRAAAAVEGFMVLPGFAGHGVGRSLHEAPRAGYGARAGDRGDFTLMPGMVLTVEPIVVAPPGSVEHAADGWTVRTSDGSPACHVERMVAITRRGSRVLGLRSRCS